MGAYIFTDRQERELTYIIRKELDEMILDIKDIRLDDVIHNAIKERYKMVFKTYLQLAGPKEAQKYTRKW